MTMKISIKFVDLVKAAFLHQALPLHYSLLLELVT